MQLAIVTEIDRCIGCLTCTVACKLENDVPIGNYWQKVLRVGPNPIKAGGTFPDVEMYFLPVGCQHCKNPPCVGVCPTGASQKLKDGTVQIDKAKCIGCKLCIKACPYGVRYFNEASKIVEKCTLCNQLTERGEDPVCVSGCSGRARIFGDLDDPNSKVSKKLKEAGAGHKLPDVGNQPSFVYLLKMASWRGGKVDINE
jgi:Fe-S-cluster-containing dehydrogenase component